MIRINLLAEKKQNRTKRKPVIASSSAGAGPGRNALLAGLLIAGLAVSGYWSWALSSDVAQWKQKHADADRELARLAEIRKKNDEYKRQKELLARKIDLITELKKRQRRPVHILDQVSRNLPEFLWLDQMAAERNAITISGKATTYNAVTNFYNNLTRSGFFDAVDLGRIYETKEGVSFSLTCTFSQAQPDAEPTDAGIQG